MVAASQSPSGVGGTFSAAIIGRLLMVSERRIRQLADSGYIPKDGHGKYALVASVQGYVRFLKDSLSRQGPAGFDEARTRRMNALAEMSELEAGRLKGILVELGEVEACWVAVAASTRTKLLAVPYRGATLTQTGMSPSEREIILKELIDEVLEDLSSTTGLPRATPSRPVAPSLVGPDILDDDGDL